MRNLAPGGLYTLRVGLGVMEPQEIVTTIGMYKEGNPRLSTSWTLLLCNKFGVYARLLQIHEELFVDSKGVVESKTVTPFDFYRGDWVRLTVNDSRDCQFGYVTRDFNMHAAKMQGYPGKTLIVTPWREITGSDLVSDITLHGVVDPKPEARNG